MPAGVSELFGIVVAGGGGVDSNRGFGYAGSGGEAKYLHWTNLADSAQVSVLVGAAGENGTGVATDGGSTSVTSAEQTTVTSVGGAIGGTINWFYCAFNDNNFNYVGLGASGTGVQPATDGAACDLDGMPGLNPSTDGTAPAVFQSLTANYGKGGGIYAAAPSSTTFGEGSSILVNPSGEVVSTIPSQRDTVILRYAAVRATTPVAIFVGDATITFNGNGSVGGSAPATVKGTNSGASLVIPANPGRLAKPGFAFTGWNTAADGSGTAYATGIALTFAGNLELFAQWAKTEPIAQKSKKLITTFVGDKAALKPAMKLEIAKWVRSLPADAVIACNGSTSGKKVTAFDKGLARARAVNVCSYAVAVRPQLTYTIGLNPSSANKVSARNVWMSFGY